MSYIVRIFLISSLFFIIAFLSGYKSNSPSGCSTPPEIIVSNPQENDNIENPPVSLDIDVRQNSTDLVSIDLDTLSVIIRDEMNKAIDVSQYILSNCDLLKKNCKLSGSVDLKEGEYLLEVKVCNTASACETKVVRFAILPINPEKLKDIVRDWIRKMNNWRCSFWLVMTNSCGSNDDPDNDCVANISGCDNCPDKSNPDQGDWNSDGVGDACQDSDGDRLMDEEEIKEYHTSPSKPDTDGDGLNDKMEIIWKTDPNKKDTDGDLVWDGDEVHYGTSPKKPDSNDNGIDDCKELGGVINQNVSPLRISPDNAKVNSHSSDLSGGEGYKKSIYPIDPKYSVSKGAKIKGYKKSIYPIDPRVERSYQFFSDLYDMIFVDKIPDKKFITREIYKRMKIEFYDPAPAKENHYGDIEHVMNMYVDRFAHGSFEALEELIMNEKDRTLRNWLIVATIPMKSSKYINELLEIGIDKNNSCRMRWLALSFYGDFPTNTIEVYEAVLKHKDALIWLLDNDDCCYDHQLPVCNTLDEKVIINGKEYIKKRLVCKKKVRCPLSSSAGGNLKRILKCEVRKDPITYKHIVECPDEE